MPPSRYPNSLLGHPFVGAYNFDADTNYNSAANRNGQLILTANSGRSRTASVTGGRFGWGAYNKNGVNGAGVAHYSGDLSVVAGDYSLGKTNKTGAAVNIKFPTNNGRVRLSGVNGVYAEIVTSGSTAFSANLGTTGLGGGNAAIAKVAPVDGAWHHYAFDFNGITGVWRIFVDGILTLTNTVAGWSNLPPLSLNAYGSLSLQTQGTSANYPSVESNCTTVSEFVVSAAPFNAGAIAKLNAGLLPNLQSTRDLYDAGWFDNPF